MKVQQYHIVCLCSIAVLVLLISGCNSSNPDGRFAIAGTVSINGDLLSESGVIEFSPIGSPAVKTPSGATIVKGKYSIPADKGLVAGEYVVRISASRHTGKFDESDPMRPPIYESIVPEKYGQASNEKITVAAKATKFDFDLKVEEADFKKK